MKNFYDDSNEDMYSPCSDESVETWCLSCDSPATFDKYLFIKNAAVFSENCIYFFENLTIYRTAT